MRDPETRTNVYWLLRFWRPKDGKVKFARDLNDGRRNRRSWDDTENLKRAYQFHSRSDARQVAKAKVFETLVKGPWEHRSRMPGFERDAGYDGTKAYFWEVVKVTETITTEFDSAVEASNAPAMVQIARAAS
jgi:hypothetical protein